MGKRKILHVVGGEASVWLIGQLAAQYRLLPEELFEQSIAAGEERVVREIQNAVLCPVVSLRRRFQIEYSAARNLARLLRRFGPDMVVCWDIQATEQFKLAMRGRRRPTSAVVNLFYSQSNTDLLFKLKSNFHHMGLHLVCGSDRLVQWANQELTVQQRVHRVYPVFEKTGETVNRKAVRRQLGLRNEDVAVFIPTDGKMHDIQQGIIGCGIYERINPNVRVVVAESDRDRLRKIQRFAEKTIVSRILRPVDASVIRSAMACCDFVVQPMSQYGESLGLLDAFGRSVPVLTNGLAEPAEFFVPNETFWPLSRISSRAIAGGLHKLLNDTAFRDRLTTGARDRINQASSEVEYRAAIVKLYQQILNPQLEVLQTA